MYTFSRVTVVGRMHSTFLVEKKISVLSRATVTLTLKAPITTAADDNFFYFRENKP